MENHSESIQNKTSDMNETQFNFDQFKNENCILYNVIYNGEKDRKTSYSPNVELLTGYSAEEIDKLPRKGLSLVSGEDLPRIKKRISDELNDPSKETFNLTYRIIRKDKKIIWVSESSSIVRDENMMVKEINGIICDITELKKNETELKEKVEEIKQSNQTKDGFISILSHDLRAPFTSILGFCEILINEPDLTKTEMMEYLNFIHSSSQTQLQLINYLLDWSKLQTGKLMLEPLRLNVQSVLYNNVSILTGSAIRKNIEIKVTADPSMFINADERLLEQVLRNLLSNAVKFSDEGKKIEISAESFNDDFIEFVVKDEGVGISDINKKKLFKIDKMFSSEGTKGEKGTGLGLSLSKEIIEKHGGKIWYYSEPGEGSEFHFTIPSAADSILIINNNREELDYLEDIIRENYPEYQIIRTDNGYRALELVFLKSPSLIITNHDMPLMTGLQMIQSIRKQDDSFSTPVIAVSDSFSDELKETYMKFGISNFIQKPVEKEFLSQSLHSILN